MRLDDFENGISPVIFRRGDDYYEDGLVEELEETAPGTWCAVVAGTMDYETEVRIKDGEIVSWDCDCPYDGYMCKHVVAVLLKLRNERPSFAEYEEVEFGVEPVVPEERTVRSFEGDEDLSNKISLLTYRQLRDFVGRYAQKDAAFREELLGTVVEKQLSGTPDTYRREVRKHICYANIYGILEKGQLLLEAGRMDAAAAIALQTLESFADEYEYYDYTDSESVDPDVCEKAGALILEIIDDSRTGDGLKRFIAEELDRISWMEVYTDYDIFDMDALVADVSERVLPKEDVLKMIDAHLTTDSEYRLADWVRRKVVLLTGLDRVKDAEDTVRHYLYLPEIRKDEVERCIASGEYHKALAMLDEGIGLAQKMRHRGTEDRWLEMKREIYKRQGDTDGFMNITRKLFMNSPTIEEYRRLKELVSADEWPEYLDRLIDQAGLRDYSSYASCSKAKIFKEEKEHGRLLNLIANLGPDSRLEALMQYSEVLKDMYSKQLLAMFVPLIQDYAEKNVNVKAYPYVVQVLRQMRRLNGGPEAVSGLIALFRQKYIRRPRMMQELDKL